MLHRTQLLLDQVGAFQRAGQWQAAIDLCDKVFQSSIRSRNASELLEILLRAAFLYSTKGERALAVEHFELALTASKLNEDFGRAARAFNGLGVLHQGAGEVGLAADFYVEAKYWSEKAGDRLTRGDVELNLGILANIRGDLPEALESYEGALAAYEEIRNRDRLAKVLNNLGMLYIDLLQFDKASEALNRGLNIARSIGDLATEGIIHTNRTELFIALGNLEAARSSCDEAFELSSQLCDETLKTDALKCYGIIFRETGKPHLAESHLKQAIQLAAENDNPLLEAEAHRELSLAYRIQDKNREALRALNRSHALFSALQAKQDQADINNKVGELEADFLSIVARWGESIEAKDLYTSGHCERVASYACKLASTDNFDERELSWFRMGAFLHDVGKTEVPEQILNKPGPLTDEERKIIEQHTVTGDEMLSTIEFPWDVRPMVRSHHERWDGRGYPDGLAGEQIPYTARILHIADVFDALTTARSYRKPLTPAEALEIMTNDIGSFDPVLLDLFCKLLPSLVDDPQAVVANSSALGA
jgi:putative nucleotidyltransferase with HDIG domain